MSQIGINTSQNVNISFTLAGIGERIVAFIIDMVIKIAVFLLLMYVFTKVLGLNDYLSSLDPWAAGAIISLLTLPVHIYTLVLESLMEGQTFGKKIMKIKVVKIDGYQANFGDYLMRWIMRIVDIWAASGIVGVVSMIVSKNNQRLGDMATGTAVISLKNSVNISHTILENLQSDYIPRFPQVVGLNDNDVRIIKENYHKAVALGDRQVLSKLSKKIKETLNLQIEPTEFTEKQFVDKIIKDYNFFTGK